MIYAKVALPLPIERLFDYSLPADITGEIIGRRALVNFAGRKAIGYIADTAEKTSIPKVKSVLKVIDCAPILNQPLLKLARIISDYYCCSLGEAFNTILPPGIRKGLAVNILDQKTAAPQGQTQGFKMDFVRGDSLEIRMPAYFQRINQALEIKKSVIFLSPEINTGKRIHNLLKAKYGEKTAFTCRKQSPREETRIWEQARNSQLDILIGTRPAVFAPSPDLGLLIIDEENGYGYKEEQMPHYHSRSTAILRGESEGFQVILGGQNPSLEAYYAIKNKSCGLISAATEKRRPPRITIADASRYGSLKTKSRMFISPVLEDRISKALKAGKKIIIFTNHKGFARYASCRKCGWALNCEYCSSRLIFHFEEKKLICRLCGRKKEAVSLCPKCNSNYLKFSGYGAEKISSQLNLSFPGAKLIRLDKEHQNQDEDWQILVATEIIFHLNTLPRAEVVAAIDPDSAINIVDFRNNEKIYSLVYRLSLLTTEELIIQTSLAEFYQRKEFGNLNMDKLFELELKERKALGLAPYRHLTIIKVRAKIKERSEDQALRIYRGLAGKDKKIEVFEPLAAVPFKARGNFYFHILLKSKNPWDFGKFLKKHLKSHKSKGTIVTIDVDPQ